MNWMIPNWFAQDDKMTEFAAGFKKGFDSARFDWTWRPEYTVLVVGLSIVILLYSRLFDRIFLRYRRHVRARRRDRKRREHLIRLLIDTPVGNEGQKALLQRLISYQMLNPESGAINATPEQLLKFTQNLFKHIHNLDYDKRGRLVVQALEEQMEETLGKEIAERAAHLPPPAALRGAVVATARESTENMGKAAKVALGLIKMKKPVE